jgi:TPR repeat protein
MTRRHFAALVLVLVLAGCADRDEDLAPVIPPLPTETVQRAEAGDAAAQFKLAGHCLVAEPDDQKPMLRWLRESAQRGYPLAQTSLGVLYLNGDGVPLDQVEAYAWFTLAADQGESGALEAEAGLSIELSEEELTRAKELATRYATLGKHP